MGGTDAEFGFIMFYIGFFSVVALLGTIGASSIAVSGDFDVPSFPSSLNVLTVIDFGIDLIIYFFFLGGLTLIGLPAIYASLLGLLFNVGLAYVLVRIVRGG